MEGYFSLNNIFFSMLKIENVSEVVLRTTYFAVIWVGSLVSQGILALQGCSLRVLEQLSYT